MAAQKISPGEPWFAGKCLSSHPSRASDAEKVLYEERITLWRASSWDEAFRLAEAEAQEYASSDDCVFHFATDAFHLFDESVGHGAEIWSTMRGSGMDPEMYKQLSVRLRETESAIIDSGASLTSRMNEVPIQANTLRAIAQFLP